MRGEHVDRLCAPMRRYVAAVAVIGTSVAGSWVTGAPPAAASGTQPTAAAVSQHSTQRVSVAPNGDQANGRVSAMSSDGRHITFQSTASNLVPDDTNGQDDIFTLDRDANTMKRASVASDGTQSSSWQWDQQDGTSISADGRYVAYASTATNLVPGDTNHDQDIFVWDRDTGVTRRASVASNGTQANWFSVEPHISGDGRYIAYASVASNLVPGDTNDYFDVFLWDRVTGATQRVSVAADGSVAGGLRPSISQDGRYVGFVSGAQLVPDDTNDHADEFLFDRVTGQLQRISVAADGTQGDGNAVNRPVISADGRFVAYGSYATNLVPGDVPATLDLFVWDRATGATERLDADSDGTQANDWSVPSAITPDGRYVAIGSIASNLVPGDTNDAMDAFVWDRTAGTFERVSVSSDGEQANSASGPSAISDDGRYVSYTSNASNLVADDTNDAPDIFVWDRDGGAVPEQPAIALQPASEDSASATVEFTTTDADNQTGDLTYSCSLDHGDPAPCSSPYSVAGLGPGSHRLSVVAADPVGNRSVQAGVAWVRTLPAPVPTQSPQIIGTPAWGHLLTATPGTWPVAGLAFSYQWLRNGVPIPGATTTGYRVGDADLGRQLSVRLTATAVNYHQSTSTSMNVTAHKALSTITAKARTTRIRRGARAHIRVTLTLPAPGAPNGTVKVIDNGHVIAKIAAPTAAGRYSLSIATSRRVRLGRHALRVVYSGTARAAAATTTLTIRVIK